VSGNGNLGEIKYEKRRRPKQRPGGNSGPLIAEREREIGSSGLTRKRSEKMCWTQFVRRRKRGLRCASKARKIP